MNVIVIILLLSLPFIVYKYYRSKKQTTDSKESDKTENREVTSQNTENTLDTNEDFIKLLKNNFSKTKVHNETFRVQNLLNEVYGLIESSLEKHNIEFVYDIEGNIPIELVGDTLYIEQILHNLLSMIIPQSQDRTIVVTFKKKTSSNEVLIQINSNRPIIESSTEIIEATKKLLAQLNAHLSFEDNTYTTHLPFLHNSLYDELYFTLPESVLDKHVLLIEDNPLSAQSISKTLKHFGLTTHHKSTIRLKEIADFTLYDIIVVDSKILTPTMIRYIKEAKKEKKLHIISLEILYGQRDRSFRVNPLIYKYLYKPLSTNMIFGFLYQMYVMQDHEENDIAPKKETRNAEIVFIDESENITPESFQDFDGTHILVVEDNSINQKIIEHLLAKSKIHITIANNGQEALNLLKEGYDIDIILMDINMPIMDGFQATKKIRKNTTFSSLPIIVISSFGFRNEIEQMYLAGANAHINKPFKIGELYSALKIFLDSDKDKVGIHEYHEDTNILNTQKAISSIHNILAYYDNLRESLVTYTNSDEMIKKYIIQKDYVTLDSYCKQLLEESEYIGATSLAQVLNELLILLDKNEEKYFQKYILLYRDEWIKTKRHIELYLKSVNMY